MPPFGLSSSPNIDKLKEKHDFSGLIGALRHKNPEMRARAARALQLGDGATEDFTRLLLLHSDTPRMRLYLPAHVLGDVFDARAVDPLIIALKDDDAVVRSEAATALGQLQSVAGAFAREDLNVVADVDPRAAALLRALATRKGQLVKSLRADLKDADQRVRESAARALEHIDDSNAKRPSAARAKRPQRRPTEHPRIKSSGAPRAEPAPAPSRAQPAAMIRTWGTAPAGNCDICHDTIGAGDSTLIPNHHFRDIVRLGYNPIASGRLTAESMFAAGIEATKAGSADAFVLLMGAFRTSGREAEWYEGWKSMVSRDTTDWGVCRSCARDIEGFVRGDT